MGKRQIDGHGSSVNENGQSSRRPRDPASWEEHDLEVDATGEGVRRWSR